MSQQDRNNKLRVAHVIETLGPGGAERLLYTNLKHFDRKRIESTVITVYSHATTWVEPIKELGVNVVSLNCRSARDIPKGVTRLRNWLRANDTDLIHSHLWAANIISRVAGRLANVPVISSVHNPDHEPQAWADGAEVSMLKRHTVKALDRWTANIGNKRMIAVSDYVRHSASRDLHFSLDSIELVYNPFDVDLIKAPPGKSRADLLREFGLPDDSLILLNVARVSPQKGLVYAVRALPEIVRQYPGAQLVSVGSTADAHWVKQLKSEAESLDVADHFHLLGAQSNVVDFLRASDVFVFPSLYEGLGIALIEAMAAGCVCVATNTGPIPEVLEEGKDGILVPPADPQQLARAICEVLGDPVRRSKLSAAATESAYHRFQPGKSTERLLHIYESLVDQGRNSRSRN